MPIIETYKNLIDRAEKVALREGDGYVMTHDDFDPNWKVGKEPYGTLIFDIPIPKSDDELYQEQLNNEFNEIRSQVISAINNWDKLTLDQKDDALKNLLKWSLWKDGCLGVGVLTGKNSCGGVA